MAWHVSSIPYDDGPSPRDPRALCDRCGQQGTVARVTHHGTPAMVERFCGACWREVRGNFRPPFLSPASASPSDIAAFVAGVRSRASTVVSRSWDDALDFIRLYGRPLPGAPPPTPQALAEVAADLVANAADMDGPMPGEIESFIRAQREPGP